VGAVILSTCSASYLYLLTHRKLTRKGTRPVRLTSLGVEVDHLELVFDHIDTRLEASPLQSILVQLIRMPTIKNPRDMVPQARHQLTFPNDSNQDPSEMVY
jgi:hypothetical protein